MNALLAATLEHLQALVAFDTRNPPRAIAMAMFDWLRTRLPGFELTLTDHGAGSISLFASRGRPKLLFNVHLDTVPDSPAWSASPFELRVDDERAVGLGACDIKGAAAALLAVVAHSTGDCALLFTTDEEANDPRGVAAFLGRGLRFDAVIVAEPTGSEAVLAHRGISSARIRFKGEAGHASLQQTPAASALHQAVRWGSRALELAESHAHERFGGLTGLRLNLGHAEGGIKANVIAPTAELRFGFRPLPSTDSDMLLRQLGDLADPAPETFEETFRGPPLPAGDVATAETKRLAARDAAEALALPIGNAVDFWTEAALFSAAGHCAMVYGPGDIAQAHAADEWVLLDQLSAYADAVFGIIDAGKG